jgi:hypothetical protein
MTLADDRKTMIGALKKLVVPGLRTLGFSGSFPHFRRLLDDRTDLLTFQFDRHGGGFVVELATWPPGEFAMPWGERVPPEKLTAHHIPPNSRLRLGAQAKGDDYWFRYDHAGERQRGDIFERLAEEVVARISGHAEAWYEAH